jgi:hypothetical protein
MDENIGRNSLFWNVYACYSTTKAVIDKWMAQPDSAHQIGLEPTLHRVLIVEVMVYKGVKIQLSLDGIFVS